VQTFAKFDEVYIPALALTKQEKAKPSKAAFAKLMDRWRKIRPEIADAMDSDAKWPQDVLAIDVAIRSSGRQIKAGQFAEAHETLEVIRDLMLEARRRNNISYALDSLSDFHLTMEEIVKPAMKMTPETLTDEEIKRLQAACRIADKKWKAAEATEFDLGVFGIDRSEASRLGQFIKGERQAIADLQAALQENDKQKIIESARGLKPPFAKTYMFFGDFPQPANPGGNSEN
jgi:hypothetical protein